MTVNFISPDQNFLNTLVSDLLALWEQAPLEAAQSSLFVPTRRLTRVLSQAFLEKAQGQAIILPKIYAWSDFWRLPCGDHETLEPPSSWLLKSLYFDHVQGILQAQGLTLAFDEVLARAEELLDFKEALDRNHLAWPLQNQGAWDMAPSHIQGWHSLTQDLDRLPSQAGFLKKAYERLKNTWTTHPWPHGLYVVGMAPESCHDHHLLELILQQPKGGAYFWGMPSEKTSLPKNHPQAPLMAYSQSPALLKHFKTPQVQFIYDVFSAQGDVSAHSTPPSVTVYTAKDVLEESEVIAWSMKRSILGNLETVALVTPHRSLGDLVRLRLKLMGIEADDASGLPLIKTKSGSGACLLMNWINHPSQQSAFIAFLKHPLITLESETGEELRHMARAYELHHRKGVFGVDDAFFHPLMDRLEDQARSWPYKTTWHDHLDHHQRLLENICPKIWNDEAIQEWFATAKRATFQKITRLEYQRLLESSWRRTSVRPAYGVHPRVFIWDVTQAQGQRPDHVILGGFNHGTWPPKPKILLGLEEGEQHRLGLASYGESVGALAQRLVPLLLAPRVMITRSLRDEGALTTPSCWWHRLMVASKKVDKFNEIQCQDPWDQWLSSVNPAPQVFDKPCLAPISRPKDRQISVTEIERLFMDPYVFRLQKDLRLTPLPLLEEGPDQRLFGQLIHQLLYEDLQGIPFSNQDLLTLHPLWPDRANKILTWFRDQQQQEAPLIAASHLEIKGSWNFEGWTLTAVVDRIDVMQDGSLRIIDYKTGRLPSRKDVELGPRIQLPLMAAMMQAGAFAGIPKGPLHSLAYWSVPGNHYAFEKLVFDDKLEPLITNTQERIKDLLKTHEQASYSPKVPTLAPFDQLARVSEWLVT